jgi:hypothetical protein
LSVSLPQSSQHVEQETTLPTQTFPLEKLPILEDWNLYTELEKELGEAKLHLSKHFPCESTNLGEVVRLQDRFRSDFSPRGKISVTLPENSYFQQQSFSHGSTILSTTGLSEFSSRCGSSTEGVKDTEKKKKKVDLRFRVDRF